MMKLEVHERIVLLNLLPPEEKSNIIDLRERRVAREALSLNHEEAEAIGLKATPMPNGNVDYQWDEEKASETIRDVPISRYIMLTIRDKLVEMNRENKLGQEHISLYEKFVETYRP